MTDILTEIRQSCASIAENARDVRINLHHIDDYAAEIIPDVRQYAANVWGGDWHFHGDDDAARLSYVLCLDSINFGSGYFNKLKKRIDLSGYASVATCLKEIYEERPLTADDFVKMSASRCAEIFEQDMNDPALVELMENFADAIRQTGQYLITHYHGDMLAFLKAADNSVSKLVSMLIEIPQFQDYATYNGHKYPIMKRAQITAADIYCAFGGTGVGAFDDIARLTIFADNVVPHVLRYDDLLSYSDDLKARIDGEDYLKHDEPAEVELRACSIHCVELIHQAMIQQGITDLIPMNIDHYIWHKGHEDKYMSKTRHRTKTIYY